MNTQTPTPLSNSDELTRKLMNIPYHRRWAVEVAITTLGVVNRYAPWLARFIKPIAPAVGAALCFVADTVFEVTEGIHIKERGA
jgi:hypothetical protein